MKQKSYEVSHAILGLIEVIAWLSVVSGVIIGLAEIGNPKAMLPSTVWFGLVFSSVGMVALCRVGKAILDIAENTARSSQLLSQAVENQAARVEPSAAATIGETSKPTPDQRDWSIGPIEVYRGHTITGLQTKVFASDRHFDSVDEARRYLNSIPVKQT